VTRSVSRLTQVLCALLLAAALLSRAIPAPADDAAADPRAQARALTRQAEALIDQGKCAEAAPLLEQACGLAPTFLRPLGLAGLVCQMSGDCDRALDAYAAMQCGILSGPDAQCHKVARLCAELFMLVNKDRGANGLRMLRPHPMLSLQAMRHSEEMRDLGYFNHESPVAEHRTPAQRFLELFGFRPYILGENIAVRRGGEFSLKLDGIRDSHKQLMSSPGHRANILGDKYTDLGLGIAANERGDYWVTEEFVRFVP
jgi:hypothetical protein